MEEISDIKRDFNIDKMCRTCLQETEDEMHEIFGSIQQEPDALSLNQVLLNLTGNIQVDIDKYEKVLCIFEILQVFTDKSSDFLLFYFRFSRTMDCPRKSAKNARKRPSCATTSKSQSKTAMQR